ncbi:radical SAM protein, partial [bacterium]|nr:radical SAM protein [bacterium]
MSRPASCILIKNAKALLSEEKGTLKKPWSNNTTVVLVYPNRYHVGMSNLGFQSVYQLLNNLPDTLCERSFLPEREEQWELTRSQRVLFSFESFRPLRDFHLIAFSLSFENDYINVLTILKLANIPLCCSKRGNEYPIVIAGGV